MPPVRQGFPHSLSDDDLADELSQLASIALNWPTPILPELTLALIQAGLLERNRREMRATTNLARMSLFVAVAALAVSIITLVIAAIT